MLLLLEGTADWATSFRDSIYIGREEKIYILKKNQFKESTLPEPCIFVMATAKGLFCLSEKRAFFLNKETIASWEVGTPEVVEGKGYAWLFIPVEIKASRKILFLSDSGRIWPVCWDKDLRKGYISGGWATFKTENGEYILYCASGKYLIFKPGRKARFFYIKGPIRKLRIFKKRAYALPWFGNSLKIAGKNWNVFDMEVINGKLYFVHNKSLYAFDGKKISKIEEIGFNGKIEKVKQGIAVIGNRKIWIEGKIYDIERGKIVVWNEEVFLFNRYLYTLQENMWSCENILHPDLLHSGRFFIIKTPVGVMLWKGS